MEDQIKVKVSGQDIYRAVRNYLNNNQAMKDLIEQNVKSYFDNGVLQNFIGKAIKEKLQSTTYYDDAFKKAVVEAFKKEYENKIDALVKASIKKSLKEIILVNVKGEEL